MAERGLLQELNEIEEVREVREVEDNEEFIPPEMPITDHQNPFEGLTPKKFRNRFRFHKRTAWWLCELLRPDLERPTARSRAIPAYLQVLSALDFFANGAHQRLHGDNVNSQISQASICRVVKDVSVALARRRGEFIKFPNTANEFQDTAQDFYDYSRFPGIIGAIDGTHIKIRSPGGPNGLFFINRKNESSINVQVVCNHQRVITNVVARWPGATHDSRIFNNSRLKEDLEMLGDDSLWLVGDAGYACLTYLMTPLLRPNGEAEERYNSAHKRARNIIERTFGMMKRRFPCLNLLRVRLDTALTVIVACAVLWNISIQHNDPDFGCDPVDDDGLERPHPGAANVPAARAGTLRRQHLIREHFGH